MVVGGWESEVSRGMCRRREAGASAKGKRGQDSPHFWSLYAISEAIKIPPLLSARGRAWLRTTTAAWRRRW